ncbi:MAG: ATP-binding protein [Candidatus Pacebacteria bacterium]|nr:ATP-binding protein [Candidatus Paceibacterota bacterium]
MKGKGIRNRLIVSFFLVIASLAVFNTFLFLTQVALIQRYKAITDNMITEYQVVTTMDSLVSSYNATVKLVDDPQQLAKYNAILTEVHTIFTKLDTTISNEQSRSAYLGLKNTSEDLISVLNVGIEEAKVGNISDTNTDYSAALQKQGFVHQNAATLIFDELDYTEQIQAGIAHDELMTVRFGGTLFFLLVMTILGYSLFFSRKLTEPLIDLARLAKKISDGDLKATVDAGLLSATDEVGSLANSFKIMVEALRKNIYELDSQLLASINSLPLGFILLDTADRVLLLNHLVQELLPEKKPTFAALGALFTPAVDIAELDRLIGEKKSYELPEAKLGERSFHITATPVVLSRSGEEGDEIIGSVILMEDITQEKMLEQSKDAFLAIAAHEMRTPLTIIRGNAELLLDEASVGADQGLKSRIESVLRSAIRLLDIVNDFLDVQRLESGRVALNVEPVDAVAIFTEAAHDLAILAQQKGLTITLDVPSDLGVGTINVDKYRLQQIATNVISNAIHYTEHGGVTVSFRKEEKNMVISFTDTGIGIDPQEQARLFKKFETGRVFMRSREYGSGLGLYISRFLAHLMGGDLVLEKSEVGKGSVFCLTLPRGDVAG